MQSAYRASGELPAHTDASDRMSKELKRRGFRFVGGTICYSLMQACGMVNDHVVDCFRHARSPRYGDGVAGPIAIVIFLLLLPVLILMAGAVGAAHLRQPADGATPRPATRAASCSI